MGTNQRAQIVMSDAEIAEFIEQSRTCTMATVGPNGTPHLVAMWYAVIDGQIWFETKSRAQKTVNLRRNPANGWAYFGLAQALRAQKKTMDAAQAEKDWKRVWPKADVKLTASVLY